MEAQIAQCKAEIKEVSERIARIIGDPERTPQPLVAAASSAGATGKGVTLQKRRVLRGHFGKIYAMQWANDSKSLASAGNDGKLIAWNAFSTNKTCAFTLRSSWAMACAYSSTHHLVASGGLDNTCSIYKLPPSGEIPAEDAKPLLELTGHEGYISSCHFLDNGDMLTASGDGTCVIWDLSTNRMKAIYSDHEGDVMSASVFENHFVTGSCDATCKMWDMRDPKFLRTFRGHESDVNSVQFFSNGTTFVSGSDDSTCRLYDMRSASQLNKYHASDILLGVTSVAVSHSGSMLFSGYEDGCYRRWDALTGKCEDMSSIHQNRLTAMGVARDGQALATASWDSFIYVLA